jgi:lipoprotein LprG
VSRRLRGPARLALGAVAVVVTGTGLTACSGAEDSGASPEDTLAAAKRTLDDTSGVRLSLSTPRLPTGVDGLVEADGVGTHAPAFKGDIKVATGGITADAAVVAVDRAVYAKLPFTAKFVKIDPADYGAPDPADLMSADRGLSSLLTAATDVTAGDTVRSGKVVLRTYAATLPGTAVAAVLPSASAKDDFDTTFTVSDDDELAKAVISGPFYPQADDVTYTITFDDYDVTADIKAP